MVMDYFKKRAQKSVSEQGELPAWVSDSNASLRAWQYVEELKKEKALYIKHHNRVSDYLTKRVYQIKGADVAKALGMSRASLMNTSKYSNNFREYLDNVNQELKDAKNQQLEKSRKSPSRGGIRRSKDELAQDNAMLKKKIAELEAKHHEDLVRYAFDQLPLPVKKKLGID